MGCAFLYNVIYNRHTTMEKLHQKYELLVRNTNINFKRYLYDKISWESRLVGIIGPRGVGKTTMILQYIKENLNLSNTLFFFADDLYFSENKLFDTANQFYINGGKHLFIDEIHKYDNWSRELKNIYDSFPNLKIMFTGSSVLDIMKGTSDLSRRAIIYNLHGLSFREYLKLFHNYNIEVFSFEQIISNKAILDSVEHPLPLFKDYLKRGYYPFGIEEEMNLRLSQIIIQTLETDIPHYANMSVGTSRKLKRLLSIIAESVPFKPNFSKIADLIQVSRNSLDDYFHLIEQAGLIGQLQSETKGLRGLGKVDKVYLDNTNLIYNLVGEKLEVGNLRETFFYNQMKVGNDVTSSKNADFVVNGYTFELGGKSKKQNQIESDGKSFIVKDDIEYGYRNTIPLWAFGLSY